MENRKIINKTDNSESKIYYCISSDFMTPQSTGSYNFWHANALFSAIGDSFQKKTLMHSFHNSSNVLVCKDLETAKIMRDAACLYFKDLKDVPKTIVGIYTIQFNEDVSNKFIKYKDYDRASSMILINPLKSDTKSIADLELFPIDPSNAIINQNSVTPHSATHDYNKISVDEFNKQSAADHMLNTTVKPNPVKQNANLDEKPEPMKSNVTNEEKKSNKGIDPDEMAQHSFTSSLFAKGMVKSLGSDFSSESKSPRQGRK